MTRTHVDPEVGSLRVLGASKLGRAVLIKKVYLVRLMLPESHFSLSSIT